MRLTLAAIGAVLGLLLSTPVVLLGLSFWIVARLTRVFARLFEPTSLDWQQVIEFHPTVGWKPRPNLDAYCRFGAGIFHVQTDSQGWSGRASLDESEVVIFGDSYAFGYGINSHAMFSEINPNLAVKPIGSPGYSMVHEVLWMRQLSSQLKGKLVVWFIYVGNDLYDNVMPNLNHYRMPFVRRANGTGKWEIVTDHVRQGKWSFVTDHRLRRQEKLSGIFGNNGLSDRIYSACEFLIEEGKGICDRAGARLAVMCVPWVIQLDHDYWQRTLSPLRNGHLLNPDLPEKKISDICRKLEVPFVAARDYLDIHDHIPNEGHWTERGHQRVAKVLQSLHEKYVVGDST